jgi:hypothetical protein
VALAFQDIEQAKQHACRAFISGERDGEGRDAQRARRRGCRLSVRRDICRLLQELRFRRDRFNRTEVDTVGEVSLE